MSSADDAARRRLSFSRRFAPWLFDVGWVLSYALLPRSYALYRGSKLLGNWIFGRAEAVQPAVDWTRIALVVDGFRHSGNTFLTDNLLPEWQPRTVSIMHRAWPLAAARRRGVPAFLLIRDPLDVALSRHHRMAHEGELATYGVVSSVSAALACWYLYHGSAWRLRHSLAVLPFDMLEHGYPELRARIEERIGPALADAPSFMRRNRHDGPRPVVPLSPLARWLLKLCRRRHARFMAFAMATGVPPDYCRSK